MREYRAIAIRCVHVAVVLCLMFAPYVLPHPDFLTDAAAKVLGVFFGCIYGWLFAGTVGTSLLGMIFLGFVPDYSVTGVFQSGYGGDTVLLIFFMATFAGILEQVGLGEKVAAWVLARKFSRRGPWALSFALLVMAYCTAFVTSIMPGILISWGILTSICQLCEFKKGDAWPKWMAIGIVLACCMGHSAWPIEVLAFTLLGLYESAMSANINYLAFTVLNVGIGLASIGLYSLICRGLFKPDVSKLGKALSLTHPNEPLSHRQKQVVVAAIFFFAILFIPGAFPDAGGIIGLLNTIGSVGCAALVIAFTAIVRTKEGGSLVDVAAAIKNGVPWESVMLVACAMPLSSALTSDSVGLNPLFEQLFSSVFGGLGNAIAFSIVFIAIVVLLTNVMGNLTVGIITIPLLCMFAPAVGANTAMLTVVACIACNAALLLPSGGPTAALLHGNREWFNGSREIYFGAAIAVLSFLISAIVLMLTLGEMLF